ncbi:peptidylprolyl isomerase [soil metagenome]
MHRFSPTLFFLAAIALAGCAGTPNTQRQATSAGPVLATYNGEVLTYQELQHEYERTAGRPMSGNVDSLAVYEDFLERWVNFRLKVQDARDRGLDRDSAIVAEAAQYRRQLARPYFLEREVFDEIIRDLYAKQQEEIRASHLLLQVPANAPPADTLRAYQRIVAIRDSVARGQISFVDAARRHSEDPSVVQNQGDLGYFSGGRMVHEFERAAYATPVGNVSQPIRTQFGYHLMHVADRRPARGEIRASHILVRVQGPTPADSAAALATITDLQRRLQAGGDFAALAREFSDDPGSGQRGGDLGVFGSGRMVPPFDRAAFALSEPGELSAIVETQFGYHIIKLNERRPLPTFEEAEPDLRRLAQQLPRTNLRVQEIGREFRAEVGSNLNTAAIFDALAHVSSDSLFHHARVNGFGDHSNRTFATIGSTEFPLSALALALRQVQPQRTLTAEQQREIILDTAERFLNDEAVTLAALRLEERDEDFARLMRGYVDGLLLFQVSEDNVWGRAAEDEERLQRHFQANQERYRYPERTRFVSFITRSDSLLRAISDDLDAGMDGEALRQRYAASSPTVMIDTALVANIANTPYEAAANLAEGARTTIVPFRSQMAIIVHDGTEAPRLKTFTEARAEVMADLHEVLDAEWIESLRRRYQARLYPQRLAAHLSAD